MARPRARASPSRSSCTRSTPTARPGCCCVRPGSRCTATSTGRAAVLAGLVESPVVDQDDLSSRARCRAGHAIRRTTGRGGCSPTPGSAFAGARTVHSPAELDAALDAAEMAFPLVLKALGRLHKSEGGGVVLGLRDADAARAAYDDLLGGSTLRPCRSRRWPTPRGASSDRRMRPRPDLRPGADGGPRRDPRRGARRHRLRARAGVGTAGHGGCCCRCVGRRCCSAPGAATPVDLDALVGRDARVSALATAHPSWSSSSSTRSLAGAVRDAVALDARVVAR